MATRTVETPSAEEVERTVTLIKSHMPETYKSIQAKAAVFGNVVFALVRRGLKGEANCFWACERGHVVGAVFTDEEMNREVAYLMVQFGATFVCFWGKEAMEQPTVAGSGDGTD